MGVTPSVDTGKIAHKLFSIISNEIDVVDELDVMEIKVLCWLHIIDALREARLKSDQDKKRS